MDILENSAYDDGGPGPVEPGDDTWRHPKTLGLAALNNDPSAIQILI